MECYIDRVMKDSDVQTDIKSLIPDAVMRRRMSKMHKKAVATAVECMGGIDKISELDAIITATGWGCLTESERFLRNVIMDKEQMLNPTPFIQSTFNTVGAQIALLRHNHCYNITYVNRSHSFEDAMLDATFRIMDGESEDILVGAFDESTPAQYCIMERMGLFRKHNNAEGAVFVHLRAQCTEETSARITMIDFPAKSLSEEECMKYYVNADSSKLLYNTYGQYGLFPTVSAFCFADAVDMIRHGISEVIIYNEYLGATPAVLRVQCVG